AALAGVAQRRRRSDIGNEASAAGDVAVRFLGTPMEHGIPRTGVAVYISAASALGRHRRRDLACVSCLRTCTRDGDLGSGRRRLRPADRLLPAPGTWRDW